MYITLKWMKPQNIVYFTLVSCVLDPKLYVKPTPIKPCTDTKRCSLGWEMGIEHLPSLEQKAGCLVMSQAKH